MAFSKGFTDFMVVFVLAVMVDPCSGSREVPDDDHLCGRLRQSHHHASFPGAHGAGSLEEEFLVAQYISWD